MGCLKLSYYNHETEKNPRIFLVKDSCEKRVVRSKDYYPYGKVLRMLQYDPQRHRLQGNQHDNETGLEYFNARNLETDLAFFRSVDPVFHAHQTPYSSHDGNPVNGIDPGGTNTDWIQNQETGEYVWDDNVNSASDTPDGFNYVGKSTEDVKNHHDAQKSWYDFSGPDVNYAGWPGEMGAHVPSTAEEWASSGNILKNMAYETGNSAYIVGQFLTGSAVGAGMTNLDGSPTTTKQGVLGFAGVGMSLMGGGAASKGVTNAQGFLGRGFSVKTPFDIPVQRFGNMSLNRGDFWGLRIGTNKFVNRTFGAIKPEWNSLSQYTTGTIPKGTQINFGIIGPQGMKYPGGSLQFITPSKSVINQSSKIIP